MFIPHHHDSVSCTPCVRTHVREEVTTLTQAVRHSGVTRALEWDSSKGNSVDGRSPSVGLRATIEEPDAYSMHSTHTVN